MRRIVLQMLIIAACLLSLSVAVVADNMFTWPVAGEVLTPFAKEGHRGIDIAASVGDEVVAAQDGEVFWVGRTPRGEPCISIDHPDGLSTTYLPVTASVSKGQAVNAGDIIGAVSSEIDGSADAAHLHFGVFETASRKDKRYLDPTGYLRSLPGVTDVEDRSRIGGAPSLEDEVVSGSKRLPGVADEQQVGADESPAGEPVAAIVEKESPANTIPSKLTRSQGSTTGTVYTNTVPVEPRYRRGAGLQGPVPAPGAQAAYAGRSQLPPANPRAVTSSRMADGTVPAAGGRQEVAVRPSLLAASVAQGGGTPVSSIHHQPGPTVSQGVTTNTGTDVGARITRQESVSDNPSTDHNPFTKGVRPVRFNSDAGASRYPWFARLLAWRFLPDAVAASAVLAIICLSVQQFARAAGQLGARVPVAASAP